MQNQLIARPGSPSAWTILILLSALWACAGGARQGEGGMVPPAERTPSEASAPEAPVEADTPVTTPASHASGDRGSAAEQGRQHGRDAVHGSRHDPAGAHAARESGRASETSHGHDGPLAGARPELTVLSPKARDQIAAVESAVAAYDTPARARAAGFRPALGMIPTMGVHWVSMARMSDGVTLLEPDHLMFSKIGGEQRLVGVAYAFMGSAAEAPDLFDGRHDRWHEHPEFAPAGQSLVMLHVWFVPSPDGTFAGHNPWLAYWAAGVEPPPASALHEPASASRARRLALALAEAVEPMAFARLVPGGSELSNAIEGRRQSIRSTIPRLNDARRAGDTALWNREADAAIVEWRQIRDLYLDAVPREDARQRLAAFYAEMEGGGH